MSIGASMLNESVNYNTRFLKLAGLLWRKDLLGKKPTLLALHGWLDNAASFNLLAEELKDYPLLAIDLPGHGYSEHIPGGDIYTINHYLQAVLELIDQLHHQRVILLGHSLGGAISSLVAALCPNKISQYICIDFIGTLTQASNQLVKQWRDSLKQQITMQQKKLSTYSSLKQMVDLRMRLGDIPKAAAEVIIERNAKPIGNEFTWRSDSRLRILSPYYFMEEQCLALLSEISMPGLFFVASQTYQRYQSMLDKRSQATPKLSTIHLQGGHYLHVEQAKAMAVKIKGFIEH